MSHVFLPIAVIKQQNDKIYMVRRKWDKVALEEASQLAAFTCGMAVEAQAHLPMSAHAQVEALLLGKFIDNDANVVMELQAHNHELQPDFQWEQLTCVELSLLRKPCLEHVVVSTCHCLSMSLFEHATV